MPSHLSSTQRSELTHQSQFVLPEEGLGADPFAILCVIAIHAQDAGKKHVNIYDSKGNGDQTGEGHTVERTGDVRDVERANTYI